MIRAVLNTVNSQNMFFAKTKCDRVSDQTMSF